MNDTFFSGPVQLADRLHNLNPRSFCILAIQRLARASHRGLHFRLTTSISFCFFSVSTNMFLSRSDISHWYPRSQNFAYFYGTPILTKRGVFV